VVGMDLAGISRPVVLLPQGILERLTPAHLAAQINFMGVGAGQPGDVRIGANRNKAIRTGI